VPSVALSKAMIPKSLYAKQRLSTLRFFEMLPIEKVPHFVLKKWEKKYDVLLRIPLFFAPLALTVGG
jgi:hypothetical protein